MRKNIVLVTAIGSLAAEAVILELKKGGYKVIGCDVNPSYLIANALIVEQFYQSPLAWEQEYVAFLERVCEEEDINYIIPLTDREIDVLNTERHLFAQKDICICLSGEETIKICRNKYLLYKFLHRHHIEGLIPTALASKMNIDMMELPLICKPINGRSSEGVLKVRTKAELAFFQKNEATENYIIQPEIRGNVVTVDVVRNSETGECAVIAREELIRTINGAGISVYVFSDSDLEQKCYLIAQLLDINGCVNFEFICKDNIYYFLECNPRFAGGVAFSCIAGYNCILNHMRCFKRVNIEKQKIVENQYIARKYREYRMERG